MLRDLFEQLVDVMEDLDLEVSKGNDEAIDLSNEVFDDTKALIEKLTRLKELKVYDYLLEEMEE